MSKPPNPLPQGVGAQFPPPVGLLPIPGQELPGGDSWTFYYAFFARARFGAGEAAGGFGGAGSDAVGVRLEKGAMDCQASTAVFTQRLYLYI
jgi:hypothetical protein